jgi:hypothetical protein
VQDDPGLFLTVWACSLVATFETLLVPALFDVL